MSNERKITITLTAEEHSIKTEGITDVEAIGLLRYYEKVIWVKSINGNEKKKRKSNS